MDLTTLDRVKAMAGFTATDPQAATKDAQLELLIDEVSASVARLLGRHVEAIERTEQYDLPPYARMVSLRGFPVTGSTPVVTHDSLREFTGTALQTTSYYTDLDTGLLHLDVELTSGRGVLQVVYTGGMAADTDAFVAAFPDVAGWVDKQVLHEFQRKSAAGATSRGGTQGGTNTYEGELDLLVGLQTVIRGHRAPGWFAH